MQQLESTGPKPFVFVLMPFDDAFSDVYELGIKAACWDSGAYSERLDEQIFDESMLQHIYNQIAKADLIVADMTGRNPNVFYEVGYAHALNKRVVLLTQDAGDIPFDLKHYPHIVYRGQITQLKSELARRVEWFLKQPREGTILPGANLVLYIRRQDLSTEPEFAGKHDAGIYTWRTRLDIHNSEHGALHDEAFRVGLISPDHFTSEPDPFEREPGDGTSFVEIELPDERRLHLVNEQFVLAPGGWKQVPFRLSTRGNLSAGKTYRWQIAVRLFSSTGTRDYPFWLQVKPQT